jgi:hypothetical protein
MIETSDDSPTGREPLDDDPEDPEFGWDVDDEDPLDEIDD